MAESGNEGSSGSNEGKNEGTSINEPQVGKYGVPKIEKFSKTMDISHYVSLLTNWLVLNEIAKAKKTRVALNVIGTYAFERIVNASSKDIFEVDYEEFLQLLINRFSASHTKLYYKMRFNQIKQNPNEPIKEYVTRLQLGITKCGYRKEDINETL